MDEVQSWWEVPAIAHFCYAFRDAFNLLYFEIGELEAAILNMQDPEMCISLEQLIIRFLQGCFEEKDVTADNWEEKLHELFEENCDSRKNPVLGASFHFLSPRSKVEVLLKLCEFRLDAEGALDVIKDIPADSMKASCVGKDSHNNVYWYFCDERLYKEDPSVKSRKSDVPAKSTNVKSSTVRNGKRTTTREKKTKLVESNKPWSIVCHNMCEWETFLKPFVKSKSTNEKEMVNQVKNKYLPMLKDVVAEKDRLLRKRFLELAPKRASSRISKVQAQKKLEEQMAADAAETKRMEQEEERARKEAEKKKNEKEERKRRAEERHKIVQGRSVRAKQRDMMRGHLTDSELSSDENYSTVSQAKRVCRSRVPESRQLNSDATNSRVSRAKRACRSRMSTSGQTTSDSENEDASSDENENSGGNNANSVSGSAHSSKNSSGHQSESNNSSDEDSDADSLHRNSLSPKNAVHSVSHRQIEQKFFVRPNVIQNSYNLSKCNPKVDLKEQKVSCIPYNQLLGNKPMKPNEVNNYNIKTVNTIPSKDQKTTYYQENHNWYLKTCTKVTNSPSIIRIDFIKPPPKPQV